MMPTRVWLLRHAETAVPSVFHGAESDIGLSERGRRQARALAADLAGRRTDAVVSSAMRRAVDTATPLAAACGVPLRVEPWLHERRVGVLGGQPHTPEHPLWTDTIARWTAGETAYTTEGAESFDAIRERVVPAWDTLTAEFAGRSLVVVAHGLVCKVLLLSILPGWSVANWKRLGPIPNLAVSELIREGDAWRALSLNVVPDAVVRAG